MTRHLPSASVLLLAALAASRVVAQAPELHVGAEAVLAATHADPIPGGGGLTELRLEQPMISLSGRLLDGHLRFSSALSLERLTTKDGVLTLGGWGGGFYDREHPHDYLHEAMVSLVGGFGRGDVHQGTISLSGGKGVVPFGTDPPMGRPPLQVPVNHHWSQVMERWLVAFGLRRGPIGFEMSFFDAGHGSEPDTAAADTSGHAGHDCLTNTPCVHQTRFGDSRSARVTIWPAQGLEFRASVATIRGPAHHPGAGTGPQRMWNLSSTINRSLGPGHAAVLVELGRVLEDHSYWTALAEAQWSLRDQRFYYRLERTDRPEGPRGADPFRSAPDTLGTQSVGVTRWTVHTLGYGFALRPRILLLEPVIELSAGRAASVATPAVDLQALYGRQTHWSALVGLRVSLGAPHMMGRYGALSDAESHAGHHH